MTDNFVSYSEDFEQFRDDAGQDIRALNDATNKGKRRELFYISEFVWMENL